MPNLNPIHSILPGHIILSTGQCRGCMPDSPESPSPPPPPPSRVPYEPYVTVSDSSTSESETEDVASDDDVLVVFESTTVSRQETYPPKGVAPGARRRISFGPKRRPPRRDRATPPAPPSPPPPPPPPSPPRPPRRRPRARRFHPTREPYMLRPRPTSRPNKYQSADY